MPSPTDVDPLYDGSAAGTSPGGHPHGLSQAPTVRASSRESESPPLVEDDHDNGLQELARKLTAQSQGVHSGLFPVPDGGPLDPSSPHFSSREWAKSFWSLRRRALEGAAPRTAGVAFSQLSAYGFGTAIDFQMSVGNIALKTINMLRGFVQKEKQRVDILHDLEGVVHSGEMLAVLGPPGSGCSTFLKTIAGETHGLYIKPQSKLNYQGIHPKQMQSAFRGEAIYTAEVDEHFPQLTVGDTLYFAAEARCPKKIPSGIIRSDYIGHLRDVAMAIFGISHTKNTRVGNDFIRGVSGGERKRVTIAEAALSYAPLQCWDNSTRGLDSANAVEFCRSLRTNADIMGCTSCVAIYQAPQDAYDVFDKVIVLYEGRQIFFGRADAAKRYFEDLGFVCPEQQTTADFLTSMTSPQERVVRPGWGSRVPRTAQDFAQAWKSSSHRQKLLEEIQEYDNQHPYHGEDYQNFIESRRQDQADSLRAKSPFTLSYWQQVKLTGWRSAVLLKGDLSLPVTMLTCNTIQALIVASIFYNLSQTTASFERRCLLLFFLILMNAFGSILEILTLYAKRKIVEKHNRYAFYHPSAEALSSFIIDLPYKIINSLVLNIILYFMANLRREPGPFFFYLLFTFVTTLAMSMMFRLIGSTTKSVAQALAPSAVILLDIVLYAGFAIPSQYMKSWIGWSHWAHPVYYALESIMLSEFVGRDFQCETFVPSGPGYDDTPSTAKACSTIGSVPGEDYVSGEAYVSAAYGYQNSHRWRNLGIVIAFMFVYMILHLIATEYVASERSKGEVLVFTRQALRKERRVHELRSSDVENGQTGPPVRQAAAGNEKEAKIEEHTSVFHWANVCYDIQIKGEERRILDHVDGWVKPGTLTALMGASGAGKTTLLDVLASRITTGVVTGDMFINGKARDESFQRQTGYVQQQDLHLHTSTVREALTFSALLRQPSKYSYAEKIEYVDTVISLLGIEEYSDAVIGVPGEGLNVEQRKRLTIGVELAARPQLLLFLDEPTSGLDSQTSWSICDLMEKLTKSGQAILCTIHQPSAMLFQRFDRLLLLSKGRTIYFGDVGKNSQVLLEYFQSNGAHAYKPGVNPAEYMLEVIGAAPGAHTDIQWADVWDASPQRQDVRAELDRLALLSSNVTAHDEGQDDPSRYQEFATPISKQFLEVTKRAFQQYWRSPGYIYAKVTLCVGATLFIGLSFLNGENTQRGLQNQMFGVFTFLTIFPQLINQLMPVFASQRTMYEARERPSKTYSWKVFMATNILVEIAWNSLMAVICFVCWYFPIGLYRNAEYTNSVHSRGITMFLHVWSFFIFTSSFGTMAIAGIETPDVAGGVVNLFMIMMFVFCGVLAGPTTMPGFWIFMYRVNPFTYIVESFLGTSLANAPMHCKEIEFVNFEAPDNKTCGDYLESYIGQVGGYVKDPTDSQCSYCAMADTNAFLSSISIDFDHRWRNFGFMWIYIAFNITVAVLLYRLVRVPNKAKGGAAVGTKQQNKTG